MSDNKPAIKFYWNGIKVINGEGDKLQKAWYSMDVNGEYITVTAKEYAYFSNSINAAFRVRNETDLMTDYFDKDRFDVHKDSPFYEDVLKAYRDCRTHQDKMYTKKMKKRVG